MIKIRRFENYDQELITALKFAQAAFVERERRARRVRVGFLIYSAAMGNCCGTPANTKTVNVVDEESVISKREVLKQGASRMSESAVERAQALFQQYRRRASTASSPGGDSVSAEASVTTPSTLTRQASASGPDSLRMPRMTQKDLKLLLQDVDNELFEFVWGLFDVSGDGVVYADDFVAAMALLSSCADVSVSIEEQMKACFVMFDTRNDGRLGYAHARALTHTPHFIRSHISPLTRFRLPLACVQLLRVP